MESILGVLGTFIVIMFPAFVFADVIRTLFVSLGAPSASHRREELLSNLARELGQSQPLLTEKELQSGWWSEWASWLVRMFVSERRDIQAYYAIFVGVAVVITVAMVATNFGESLSKTIFGGLNILILTLIFRGPVWLASTAFRAVSGTTISFDTTVLRRVLDLPENSELWGYTWPFLLGVLVIVGIGWLLFWFRGKFAASRQDALGNPVQIVVASPHSPETS